MARAEEIRLDEESSDHFSILDQLVLIFLVGTLSTANGYLLVETQCRLADAKRILVACRNKCQGL